MTAVAAACIVGRVDGGRGAEARLTPPRAQGGEDMGVQEDALQQQRQSVNQAQARAPRASRAPCARSPSCAGRTLQTSAL